MVKMITYLRVIRKFEGAEEDDSVAEKICQVYLATCKGLFFLNKKHTTKSTKISTRTVQDLGE